MKMDRQGSIMVCYVPLTASHSHLVVAGPFAGEHMLEWQAQGYFSGGNVHVFRYEGVPPQQEHAAATYHQPDPLPESPCIGEHTTMQASRSCRRITPEMSSLQGRRPYQEDRCVAVNDLYKLLPQAQSSSFGGVGTAFYGVFDGHQGFEVQFSPPRTL